MSDILFSPTPQTTTEYEAIFARLLTEMQQINTQMQQDQVEIDRLKAEATAYRNETQRLKSEGSVLDVEIRARLDNIRTILDRMLC